MPPRENAGFTVAFWLLPTRVTALRALIPRSWLWDGRDSDVRRVLELVERKGMPVHVIGGPEKKPRERNPGRSPGRAYPPCHPDPHDGQQRGDRGDEQPDVVPARQQGRHAP